MDARPASEQSSPLVTPEKVHAEFEKLLGDRKHMGLRNLIGDVMLEPRNPFQATNRKPRKWIVAVGGLFFLSLLILYYFHLR